MNLLSSITRHDIRNQLLTLKGYLQLSKDALNDPSALPGYIEKEEQIAETIGRQIEFTKEYEDLGMKTPVWQRLPVVVRSAASKMAASTISVEVPDGLPEVYADPLLVKVFYNLFENSRQHGGAVTRIIISHRVTGAGLVITVTDNGSGLSIEDRKHLFERGFGKNTGLGLFLSREILGITGISISEKGTPGMGARFEIVVPEDGYRLPDPEERE